MSSRRRTWGKKVRSPSGITPRSSSVGRAGASVLAQIYFDQSPPTSVRIVLSFVAEDGSEESKAIDLDKTRTVSLPGALGEFIGCRLDAAVLEG